MKMLVIMSISYLDYREIIKPKNLDFIYQKLPRNLEILTSFGLYMLITLPFINLSLYSLL